MEEEPRAKECGSLEKRQDADWPPGPQREGRPADTTREPHEAHLQSHDEDNFLLL